MRTKILFLLALLFLLGCDRRLRASKEFSDLLEEVKFEWKGEERRAIVYDPRIFESQPLLMVLHGGGGKPENTIGMDGEFFLKSAKERGFVIVYPQGNEKKWNDFRDDPTVKEEIKNRDDVGFIRELIRVLILSHSINKNKIYLTGISNGGMMSYRLACEMPDTFKEVFPVTANMPQNTDTICKPQKPVSITVFNGTEDPLIPYYGGNVKVLGKQHGEVISTDESMRFWSEKAGCKNKIITPLAKQYADDTTQIFHHKWDCPNNRVELFEIRGGGHTWPGGITFLPEMMVGKITKEIEASKIIVERMIEK